MVLTQKEATLIEDLKSSEKLCIEKYSKYAAEAKDAQLKSLFTEIANAETKHLSMLDSITDGTVPTVPQGGGPSDTQTFNATYKIGETPEKKCDSYFCTDLLSMEKHVSGVYDTCVFEFANQGIRDVLNHIQKEEQEHGKKLYDYMSTNAMYS